MTETRKEGDRIPLLPGAPPPPTFLCRYPPTPPGGDGSSAIPPHPPRGEQRGRGFFLTSFPYASLRPKLWGLFRTGDSEVFAEESSSLLF